MLKFLTATAFIICSATVLNAGPRSTLNQTVVGSTEAATKLLML